VCRTFKNFACNCSKQVGKVRANVPLSLDDDAGSFWIMKCADEDGYGTGTGTAAVTGGVHCSTRLNKRNKIKRSAVGRQLSEAS